ncbi:uncharacterized protein LOC110393491 [Numida meleagris]|uniref:uncharacterized protein LOC110393491 n=1 Tax=Numida meleagris TaxID=8996 RepID=UPI000B3DFB21|nr:uncharacterized protein LOC110393491 [Numida meleagris]
MELRTTAATPARITPQGAGGIPPRHTSAGGIPPRATATRLPAPPRRQAKRAHAYPVAARQLGHRRRREPEKRRRPRRRQLLTVRPTPRPLPAADPSSDAHAGQRPPRPFRVRRPMEKQGGVTRRRALRAGGPEGEAGLGWAGLDWTGLGAGCGVRKHTRYRSIPEIPGIGSTQGLPVLQEDCTGTYFTFSLIHRLLKSVEELLVI